MLIINYICLSYKEKSQNLEFIFKTQFNYRMKLNFNKSGFDLLQGKISQKLNPNLKNYAINILEKGTKDGLAFIRLENNLVFFDTDMKSLLTSLVFRYHQSHYEINKNFKKHGIHLSHVDNLLNLPADSESKDYLLKNMPVKKGDTVVELGAFRGFGTIKLSQLVGKEGKVIAVEASEHNYDILKKNIEENNISNVSIINRGIWSTKGQLTFYKEKNQRNSLVKGLLHKSQNENEIEVDTVDNILAEQKIEKPDFITMEINAAEVEALRGMKNTLSKKGIRLISAGWYDYNGKPAWTIMKKLLEEYGFSVYVGKQNRVYGIKE